MIKGLRKGALLLAAAGAALALSACGVVYVNKKDRAPTYVSTSAFLSSRRAEATYRIIYTRLLDCTSGYYRVGGKFDNATKQGEISLDTGVGFQRTLFLADSHVMKIEIAPDEGATSRVTVHQSTEHSTPFVRAMEPWVNQGSEECRL